MADEFERDRKALDEELDEVLAIIKITRDLPFVERFDALGLDRKTDFAGGDWRNCDFSGADLAGSDFRNSRLFYADFRGSNVKGADFRGAGDVHTSKIHLATGWQDATFDEYQRILIESHPAVQSVSRHRVLTEKDWFFAVKNSPSFQEAWLVLDQMESAGHRLSVFAYSSVLDRAKRDRKQRAGWGLYQKFLRDGGVPDEALYTAGIGVAPNSQIALEIFRTMEVQLLAQGAKPGERAYNMVISRQMFDLKVALELFDEMKAQSIRPSRYTVFALFDACRGFPDAVDVLIRARRAGIDIDDKDFVQELNHSARYKDMRQFVIDDWIARDGLSHRDVIGRLVESMLNEPARSMALTALGFSR